MTRKAGTPVGRQSPAATETPNRAGEIPPQVADLICNAITLLGEGQMAGAIDLLARTKDNSPWVRNALGVCQMRQGNTGVALDVFRGLVLGPGGLVLRKDVPVVFQTNYATALLAAGNVSGCRTVLAEIGDENNPTVGRLRGAIKRWQQGLTFWQRVNWFLGSQPDRPVPLDPPLGDLA
jgi:hypothetical protein